MKNGENKQFYCFICLDYDFLISYHYLRVSKSHSNKKNHFGLGINVLQADAKTHRFKDRVLKMRGIWREIYGIDEVKVAEMIREDKIDILIELTGHTANNRLGVMACRPAPIQVRSSIEIENRCFSFECFIIL